MKKILNLLGVIAIGSTIASNVVSCETTTINLSKIIKNETNLGSISVNNQWGCSALPSNDDIYQALHNVFPSINRSYISINNVNASSAIITGDNIHFIGNVFINFTTTIQEHDMYVHFTNKTTGKDLFILDYVPSITFDLGAPDIIPSTTVKDVLETYYYTFFKGAYNTYIKFKKRGPDNNEVELILETNNKDSISITIPDGTGDINAKVNTAQVAPEQNFYIPISLDDPQNEIDSLLT